MHKIYFEKRCLLICPPDEQVLTNPNAVLVNINEGSQVHDLINMFEVSDSLGLVYIPSEDTERTYRLICATSPTTPCATTCRTTIFRASFSREPCFRLR